MKKNILYIILIITILEGCGNKKIESRHIVNYKIENNTSNNMYCEIVQTTTDETNEISYTYIMPNETSSIIFDKTQMVYIEREHDFYSSVSYFSIYNLNDTTFISLIPVIEQYGKIDNYWIIKNINDSKYNYGDPFCFALESYILSIDYEKLARLEKDYSMLEKFPEYYGN